MQMLAMNLRLTSYNYWICETIRTTAKDDKKSKDEFMEIIMMKQIVWID